VKFTEYLKFCGYVREDGQDIMFSWDCMSSQEAAELAEENAESDYL